VTTSFDKCGTLEQFIIWYHKICEVTESPPKDHRIVAKKMYQQSLPFLKLLPIQQIECVLDVGAGYGFHSTWFTEHGKKTTGLSLQPTKEQISDARKRGYKLLDVDMHFTGFVDESFDLIWSHHSLEHSFSPMLALREWHRILKCCKYLAITVPAHVRRVSSGHFSMGWGLGQLIYILGLTGYDITHGIYRKDGSNIRALVQKSEDKVDYRGLSWLCNLRKYLPPIAQVRETPRSIGRYFYIIESDK